MTWQALLSEGKGLLKGKVSGEEAAEARELLLLILGWTLSEYALHKDEEATEPHRTAFLAAVERRAAGEPLQYITGRAPFFGYEFKVDCRVLIPRFDTEILVEAALRRVQPGMRILDICTGSGCIPITIALEIKRTLSKPMVQIEASDISGDALCVAQENAALHKVEIRFFQSDFFETAAGKYDIITANPPYITEEELRGLDAEVRDYEPMLALFGGTDGLDYYRRITREAPAHLTKGGWLLVEIGAEQAFVVSKMFVEAGFSKVEVLKDLAGRDRVVVGRFGGG